MKARLVPLLVLLHAAAAAPAPGQGITLDEALCEMGVTLQLPDECEAVPVVPQHDVEYQAAFRFIGAAYEVRISLYPESWLVRQAGGGDMDSYIPLFAMGLLAAMAGESLYFCRTAELPAAVVKKEFGADRGMTALVKGNKSAFGRGYSRIALAFLHKTGRGAVLLSFLYNEPKDLRLEGLDFSQAYYCFRFADTLGTATVPPSR
jgi:hypothetical protein